MCFWRKESKPGKPEPKYAMAFTLLNGETLTFENVAYIGDDDAYLIAISPTHGVHVFYHAIIKVEIIER